MVKVTKIAVWKIGNEFFEDCIKATSVARQHIIVEMMEENVPNFEMVTREEIAQWFAENFDKIEARVKAAMAGA